MPERRLWNREELILALNLYLKLPFGKLDGRTPEIIHLSQLINRTPGSVSMRLNNFAAVDPYHQMRGIVGLQGGKKQVEPIWNEFVSNKEQLLFESEEILARREKLSLEEKYSDILSEIKDLSGEDKIRAVKTRVNQNAFRQIVLANYKAKCAFTGIDIPDLLVASHIIPWKSNKDLRLNPENGICLSSLYDKAYDKGYIGINENFKIILSKKLQAKTNQVYFNKYFYFLQGLEIALPKKYLPNKDFLQYHMDVIFQG